MSDNDAAIEALSRQLCEVDGNDPDEQFFREELMHLKLPGGRAFALPQHTSPVWHAYRHYAKMIIESDYTPELRPGYTPDTLYDEELKARDAQR